MRIGDPSEPATLMGPLIHAKAVADYRHALETAVAQGGRILCGGKVLDRPGFFVEPTLVEATAAHADHLRGDLRADPLPVRVRRSRRGDRDPQRVPQGLSSAIFTLNMRSAEKFLSVDGSDCGIANVNIGTSGAEIGGAFGGEKETGGGREAGSDSWKVYMRRQTCTLNYGETLPLAQGVTFDV